MFVVETLLYQIKETIKKKGQMEQRDKEIKAVEEQVVRAARFYYNLLEEPVMTDVSYDNLLERLQELDPGNILLDRVGTTPRKQRVTLGQRMYSLNKAKALEGFDSWRKLFRNDEVYIISPKMDGCALLLRYSRTSVASVWMLVQATTRGDGTIGEDITVQVVNGHIEGVPIFVEPPPNTSNAEVTDFYVTGEAVIKKSTLVVLNAGRRYYEEKPYKNARNLVNGSLGLDDINEIRKRKICFHAYGCSPGFLRLTAGWSQAQNLSSAYNTLELLGFGVVPSMVGVANTMHQQFKRYCLEREDFPFEIDGAVVAINDNIFREELGYTEHHPRGTLAIKFPDETAIVTIERIEWTLSKYGALTPQAIYPPVVLGGAELERVTLHNAQQVIDRRITTGAKIKICRSGGVIPYLVDVVEVATSDPQLPVYCPACKGGVDWDGLELRCQNIQCPGQLAESLDFFLKSIEFKGIGINTCSQLVTSGLVHSWADLWKVTPSQLEAELGWGEDHAEQIVADLAEIKEDVPFNKLLVAFQVPKLGKTNAKKIAQKFPDIKSIQALPYLHVSRWFSILGAVAGESALTGISARVSSGCWRDLENVGFTIKAAKKTRIDALRIVVTGKLSRGRKEYQDLIEAAGHEFLSSLSKDAQILVVGENVGESKIAKAEKYGTMQKDEDWLIELLDGSSPA